MEVTEAPSVHRATELVCQFYQQFIYKAFTSKQLSRICTLHLRRSLCRRHLRDIAFTSVHSVTPCAYYIRVLVYHSIFRKNLIKTFTERLICHSGFIRHSVCQRKSKLEIQKATNSIRINAFLVCKRCPLSPLLTPF